MPENKSGMVQLAIEWHIPDSIKPQYATNIVVQRLEHEYMLSFFEAHPPVIIGGPDEIEAQLKLLKSVRATCVSQIIIAEAKLPEFIEALQGMGKRSEREE